MCELEIRLMDMFSNFEENPFESDSDEMNWAIMKKLDFRKKAALCDFLIVSGTISPKITAKDLDDPSSELNDYFKPLGDLLFAKYLELYARQSAVKKKSTI